MRSVLARGAVAGVAGTLVLGAFEKFEVKALGRQPVYAPARIAERLFGRPELGPLLRWTYGAALGFALALLDGRGSLTRAAIFGVALAGAERLALPAVGATPKVRRWSRAERSALWPHALSFALGAATSLRSVV